MAAAHKFGNFKMGHLRLLAVELATVQTRH